MYRIHVGAGAQLVLGAGLINIHDTDWFKTIESILANTITTSTVSVLIQHDQQRYNSSKRCAF